MNRSYKQQYSQQQNLQIEVANNWGYTVSSNPLDTKSKKQVVSQTPKVANITLRQFKKDIPKTDRIIQVEDQIKALHNQRKVMEENERVAEAAINGVASQGGENKIMEWVQQRIRQYNSIIEHRHLMKNTNNVDDALSVEKQHQHKLTEKEPPSDIESRIAEWAQRKFEEFINPKASAPSTIKKQLPQTTKTLDKLTLPEHILKKIEQKKKELQNATPSDLTHQISINRQIANLYRIFYQRSQSSATEQVRKSKSIAAEPPQSLDKQPSDAHLDESSNPTYRLRFLSTHMNNSASDNYLIADIQNERKNSTRDVSNDYKTTTHAINKYKELEYKKYYTAHRKLSKDDFKEEMGRGKRNQKHQSTKSVIQRGLDEPYLQKKDVENYRSMQNKIRSNGEALQLWKSKIQDACKNSRVAKKLRSSSKIKQMDDNKARNELTQRQQELEVMIGNSLKSIGLEEETKNAFLKEIAERSKRHEQRKEDIFAELLRKRNNKFNKLWGTKIMVKYDSRVEAKHMLKGDAQKKSQTRVSGERGCKTSRSAMNTPNSMRVGERGISEEAILIGEQNDDEHYWRMCKNQKINLLFKRR